MVKPIKQIIGGKTTWRMGYSDNDIEEVWSPKGLVGANYYSKKTGELVKTKKVKKGTRTIW